MGASTLTAEASEDVTQMPPGARLRRPWERVRRFVETYASLARDGLVAGKRRAGLVLLAGVVGSVAQAGAVGVLVLFVQLLEKGDSTDIAVLDELLGPNMQSLVIVAAALVFLHTLSAGARYYGTVVSRRLASSYHDRAALRGITLYGRAPQIDAASAGISPRRVQSTLTRTPRLMGKSLEAMLRSVNPLFSLVGQAALLIVLNLFATVIIVPVFLLLVPILYRVSRRIQRNAKQYFNESIQGMSRGMRDCFDVAEGSNLHPDLAADAIEERWRNDERIHAGFEGYNEMLLGPHRSSFATSLMRPLVVVIVLLVLGWQAIAQGLEWSILIGYIAAVSQCVGFMETLSGNLAQLNKFYRRIADHLLLVRALRTSVEQDASSESEPIREVVVRSTETFEGGERRITLQRGTPVLLVHGTPLSRMNLRAVTDPLRRRSSADRSFWRSARFVSNDHHLLERALIANVLGGASRSPTSADDLARRFASLGLQDELNQLAAGFETLVTPEVEASMSRAFLAAVRVLALRSSGASAVLFDDAVLRRLDDTFVGKLLAQLDDQFIFICTTDPHTEIDACTTVIVISDDEIAGIGDPAWWREHAAEWHCDATDSDDELMDDEEEEENY